MASEFRFSDEEFEYRAADNGLGVVSGVIVRYGDVAEIGPFLTEQVERGAFTMGQWWANRMHDRRALLGATGANLTLSDDADALRFRLQLPETQLGRDTAYELDKGLLRGASVELGSQVKARYQGNRRMIQKSPATRFALVDKPAYPDSLLKLNRWEDWEGYQGEEEPESTRRYFWLT